MPQVAWLCLKAWRLVQLTCGSCAPCQQPITWLHRPQGLKGAIRQVLQQLPEYALVGLVTFGSMVHGEAITLEPDAGSDSEPDRICSADGAAVRIAALQEP